jgi:hypothetical protein
MAGKGKALRDEPPMITTAVHISTVISPYYAEWRSSGLIGAEGGSACRTC